jgi:exodeoxyribonuclease VII small subunit
MDNKEKKPSYTQAIAELENLVSQMESAEISIDELSEKVKRASFLIKLCREKLVSTEIEIGSILSSLESQLPAKQTEAEEDK